MKKVIVVIISLGFVISCKSPGEKRVHEKSEIDAAMREYDRLLQKMDAEGIAAFYEEHKRDSIKNVLKTFTNVVVLSSVSSTDGIEMLGDSATQTGSYVQIDVIDKKDTITVRGKYEVLWKWDGNAWKILKMQTTPM